MKILFAGSSGFLGNALRVHLEKEGNDIYRLVRAQKVHLPKTVAQKTIAWNPEKKQANRVDFEGFDCVINLAGENIASGYWTEAKKQRILASRVESVGFLADILKSLTQPPQLLISASAVGYYGDQKETLLDEASPQGAGFLADVCMQWEAAASRAEERGIRVVYMRTSTVLGRDGGVLARLLPIFKLGMGGALGTGKQYMSWIALDDFVKAVAFLLARPEVHGAVNLCTPHPVTNLEFTEQLGRILKRPVFMRVPVLALHLLLGQMADELLLSSIRVQPAKLQQAGYSFLYPEIGPALANLLKLDGHFAT